MLIIIIAYLILVPLDRPWPLIPAFLLFEISFLSGPTTDLMQFAMRFSNPQDVLSEEEILHVMKKTISATL